MTQRDIDVEPKCGLRVRGLVACHGKADSDVDVTVFLCHESIRDGPSQQE